VTRQRAVRAGRRRAAEIARGRRSDHLLELSDKGGSSRRRAPTCCGRWCRTLRRRCWGRRSTRSAARPMVSVRRSGATGATATASATGTRVGSIELPVPKLREGSYFPNRQTRSSRATAASHRSKRARAALSDTGSTVAATGSSTPRSTGSRSRRRATTRAHAPTSSANAAKARANEKHSAASNDSSSASSSRP
jgi:hypothetical protein